MKKAVSLIIVALLLSSLMMPGVFAAGTDLDPRDVYVSDTMISYAYTENDRTMVIMVYPQENRAELAYGYTGELVMYSAEISLPASASMPYSSRYWKAVELLALDVTNEWRVTNKPMPEFPSEAQGMTDAVDVFDSFMADTFGDDYFGYHLSNQVINGVPFTLMQGQQSTLIHRGVQNVSEAQNDAEIVLMLSSLLTSIWGLPAQYSLLLTAIRSLAKQDIHSLGRVDVYELNCNQFRYVSHVSDEDAPYSITNHMIYYVGFANPEDIDEDPVITGQPVHEYIHSQTFYNSYSDQFAAHMRSIFF